MYTARTGGRTTARVALQIGRPTHDDTSMAVKKRNILRYNQPQSTRLLYLRKVSSASGNKDEASTCGKLEVLTNKRSGQRTGVLVNNTRLKWALVVFGPSSLHLLCRRRVCIVKCIGVFVRRRPGSDVVLAD